MPKSAVSTFFKSKSATCSNYAGGGYHVERIGNLLGGNLVNLLCKYTRAGVLAH